MDIGLVVLGWSGPAARGRRHGAGAVRAVTTVMATLVALALLGDPGARLGGAPRRRATVRVVAWGAVAMAITAGIGAIVGNVA